MPRLLSRDAGEKKMSTLHLLTALKIIVYRNLVTVPTIGYVRILSCCQQYSITPSLLILVFGPLSSNCHLTSERGAAIIAL